MKIFRSILPYIEKSLFIKNKKKAIIIYGPRQSGKTTLAKYLLKKYPEKSEYLNCDYPDVQRILSYQNVESLTGVVKDLRFMIIDEAQRIENIGLVLKILVDEYPHLQVLATGSSSFDLSNKIKEPLTGRKKEFRLHPFSFNELHEKDKPLERKRNLERFLRFGSYPEISQKSNKEAENSLRELAGSYLFKDIFTFQQLKKPEILEKLLRLIAFQIGSQVSFHELATQIGVDQTVIQKYIHLLEEAFVIFRLGSFGRNLRNEVRKSRKIYFWDLGIRNAIIENFNTLDLRNDIGELWENFCITERLKHLNNKQEFPNTFFWRNYSQKEIDYLEEKDGRLKTFEFKWSENKKAKIPKIFVDNYPDSEFEIINKKNFDEFLCNPEV